MTRLERKLLRHGTFAGPVTQAMIDRAKRLYRNACVMCKQKEEKDGWKDFLKDGRRWAEQMQPTVQRSVKV